VLVNGGSASAAEIVAGSLQAHRRAVVLGEPSFGKGSVQHVIALQEQKAAVKLTVAYYRLPDGRIIHRPATAGGDDGGVIPDVEIVLTDSETAAVRACRHELDMAFTGPYPPAPPGAGCAQTGRLLVDRQLEAALQYLREGRAPALRP